MTDITLTFDLSVYRLAAIKKTAYKFAGRCYVQIATSDSQTAFVSLRTKAPDDPIQQLAGDFGNELLDQELREEILAETAAVRNLLLAQAFSATSLTDAVGENADYRTDPLRISHPDRP